MTTYTKITDYAAKDSLLTGNPSKVVRGTEIDAEFTSIASADADSVKVSGLGANVATFLATPSSANLAAALTDETGSGANVFATSPTLVTPALGTPSSGTLTSCTGLPISTGISGLGTGIATALAVNVGTAGSPVVNGGALGTPSSGTVTNLTGTASININGTVGATTPAAGTFTTLTSTGNATLGDAEASDTHAIKGATTLLANSASAALTVTQTGSGNAFVVEDSASTDSTPFVIDANGVTVSGHTAAINTIAQTGNAVAPGIQQHAAAQGFATSGLYGWSANAGISPNIVFSKSNSGTVGTRGVVASGTLLGANVFTGDDGTGFVRAASIEAWVDGTPGTNDMPGRLVFSTTADGASSPTERMRIDSSGNVGVGGTANARTKLGVLGTYPATTGVSISLGILGNVDPAATSAAQYCTFISPTVGAGTLPDLRYNYVSQGTFTGSVTSQYGYSADSTLTGATNNYGFYGGIAAGTNRYNFYAAGTADNYLAGSVGIGSTTLSGSGLKVNIGGTYPAAGGASQVIYVGGNVDPAAATSFAYLNSTFPTVGAGALPILTHINIAQGAFTGTVTNQYGVSVAASFTGATNNYGFYANIAAAANRYNFYAAGTADNYFAGNTGVGAAPTYRFDVTGIVANVAAFRRSGGQAAYFYIDTTDVYLGSDSSVTNSLKFTPGSNAMALLTNNAPRLSIDSAGAVTIGGTLTANGQTVGYLNIPQNSQSAPYTLVLGDAGKHILHPSADTTARTITIPANSSVAFPIGTAVTFVNQASAGVMTIAITTDTMRLAGAGTTGSRTLAANGVATAIKLTSTEWIISGTNLT